MQKFKFGGMRTLEDVDSNASSDTERTLGTMGFAVTKSESAEGRTDKADFALVYVETNDVRIGSGTPTDALGLLIVAGDSFILDGIEEIENVKVISAVAGVHALLHAQIGYSS